MQVENLHRACIWFFRAKTRLVPSKNLKEFAALPRKSPERCLGHYDFAGPNLGSSSVEGYAHGDEHNISLDEVYVGTTLVSQALSAGRVSPT